MRWPKGPARLRTRITAVSSAVMLAMMALAAVAMLMFQHRQLFDAVDASLSETVDAVSREFDVSFNRGDPPGPRGAAQPDLMARVAASSRSLQLLNPAGEVVAASRALVGQPALVDAPAVLTGVGDTASEFATADGEGTRFRVAWTETSGGQILVAGYSLADVDQSLRTQRATLLVAIPLLSGLVGLLIWQVLGRALKPVEAIREEVTNISGQALDRRVPVPERSIELASLATTMNEMLDRLDISATRQHRFVSDAAHELRSPLAGIRSQLEVNVHHPDAPDRAESEAAILAETVRLQNLVDNLLLLARIDNQTPLVPQSDVDLDDLVLEEASTLRRATDLEVRLDEVSAARVHGDAAQLRRVIRNLADNAARHARHTVSIRLRESSEWVELAITDDGPGIPADQGESIFDRFTRLDESRDREAGGSGLGLAISREIIEQHGGTINLDTSHVGGARFVVRLPRPG